MKININYKLIKNRTFNKNLYISLLVVLIILELLSFALVEKKIEKVADNQYSVKKDIRLNTIINELEISEIDIVNMNRNSRGYEFKILVIGTAEEVKKKVEKLGDFNISSFELDVKDKLIKGTLTISTIS